MADTFIFDLNKQKIGNPVAYGRVGDGGKYTVSVKTFLNGAVFDLTGWTITFEGVTSESQSKIFDSFGITVKDLKNGLFEYTFPSAAFSVAGTYERAYFSFMNGDIRLTSADFQVNVFDTSDINAEEAQTIITEYNKLVAELQEKTNQYISDSDTKFTELNKKIADLQIKIDDYTSSVQTTANDATSKIDTAKDDAIKAVNDALAKLKAADFYTKEEVDDKLTSKADDSKVVHNTGDETIAGKKTFSDDTTVKDLKVTGKLELTSDVLEWTPLTMENVTSAVIKYKVKSGIVFFTGAGNWGTFTANQAKVVVSSIPENYRPDQGIQVVLTSQNANNDDKAMEVNILEDGTIKIWSEPASTSGRYGAFDVSYPLIDKT